MTDENEIAEQEMPMLLLNRLVAAYERLASRSVPVGEEADGELELPPEVRTVRAAEIVGVSKDTVLEYKRKGLLPFRNMAPPGSTKPVFMFPLSEVVRLRTTYQTEEPAPVSPQEPRRRSVTGSRKFKHVVIIEDEE